jgi:4-hydroxybenzoate polyprenyltransferase/geranylgeranylglycerol-phosphate geranylgeranyltransferase
MATALIFGTMVTGRPSPWLGACAAVFWVHDAGSNLIGAFRDLDGDRAGGYQTAPVKYGRPAATRIAAGFWLAWCALAAGVFWSRGSTYGVRALLAVAAILGLTALIWVVRAPATRFRRAALEAHEVLVVERLVLAAAFVAAGAGLGTATAVLAVTVTITIVSQMTLRNRYEFVPEEFIPRRPAPALQHGERE